MEAEKVALICYYDGTLIMEGYKPRYEGGRMKSKLIFKSINYIQLKDELYRLTKYDRNRINIKITCKFPTSGGESVGLTVEDDDTVETMLNLYPKHASGIEVYLEKEEIPGIYTRMLDEDNDSTGFLSLSGNEGQYGGDGGCGPSNYLYNPDYLYNQGYPSSSIYPYNSSYPSMQGHPYDLEYHYTSGVAQSHEGISTDQRDVDPPELQQSHTLHLQGYPYDLGYPSTLECPQTEQNDYDDTHHLNDEDECAEATEEWSDDGGDENDEDDEINENSIDTAIVNNEYTEVDHVDDESIHDEYTHPEQFMRELPDEYENDGWVDLAQAINSFPGVDIVGTPNDLEEPLV